MIPRALVRVGLVLLGVVLVLAAEVWLALRREYLPTDRPLELDRSFGSNAAPPLRCVVLGDSTSVGLGITNAAQAYPALLAQRLAAETGRRVELTILGASGARVEDVARDQAPKAVQATPT